MMTDDDTVDLSVLVVDNDPAERRRISQALASLGILGVQEMADQLEALVATSTAPCDLVVYGLSVVNGQPTFAGDATMLDQSACIIVMNAPLKPALIEFLSPKSKVVGYPLIMGIDPGRAESSAVLRFPKNLNIDAQMKNFVQNEQTGPGVEALLAAVQRKELQLLYEPLVRPADGSLAGAQVTLVPAALLEFASTEEAQESLAHYFFLRTLEALVLFRKSGLSLRLHLSLGGYWRQPQAASQLLQLFSNFGGQAPADVVLDVEEREWIASPEIVMANVNNLKSQGFSVALAGYAGQAGLEHLSLLPLSFLKVNPSHLMRGPQASHLGEIVELCQRAAVEQSLQLVFQGVSRQDEWNLLLPLGCHQAQGELISPALAYPDFLDWIQVRSQASGEPQSVQEGATLNFLLFAYVLSVTQEQGISWGQSFRILRDHNPEARSLLGELEHDLLRGQTLSSAVRRHHDVFHGRVSAQIEGAEEVSRLPTVLRRLYERSLAQVTDSMGTSPLEVSVDAAAHALQEIAELLDLGQPLNKAVRQASTGCDLPPVRAGLEELLNQIEREPDTNLGSLRYPPKVFSAYAAVYLEVGQMAGRLPAALRDLAELVRSRKR